MEFDSYIKFLGVLIKTKEDLLMNKILDGDFRVASFFWVRMKLTLLLNNIQAKMACLTNNF